MSQDISRDSDSAIHSSADLPPPRDRKKLTRSVSPPLSHVPLSRFNYLLAALAALLVVFYAWRLAQWKAEVGGWWNLALGRKPPVLQNQMNGGSGSGHGNGVGVGAHAEEFVRKEGDASVEQRIEELAVALGIPSKDLAHAIAGAVREFVPPASLSSIAAHETGEAVRHMVDPSGASSSDAEQAPGATASRGFEAISNAFEAAVGLDEPPSDVSGDA